MDIDVRLRHRGLVGVERRKCLKFNQLVLQVALFITDQSEVNLNEHRMLGFIRNSYILLGSKMSG